MSGYLSLGRLTVFGENAMHWGVRVKLKNNFLCFRLPFRCYGGWWPLYLYISPDGTPTSAIWGIGRGIKHRMRKGL